MTPIEVAIHLINFMLPALGVAALSAAAVRLLWRRSAARVGWPRLAVWSAATGLLALAAAVVWQGRDGTIAGYAALVVTIALTQAWMLRARG